MTTKSLLFLALMHLASHEALAEVKPLGHFAFDHPQWQRAFCRTEIAPTPEEMQVYLNDVSPEAMTKAINALFKDPSQQSTNTGIKLLYLYTKYGIDASEFNESGSLPFTDYELDQILVTLSDLPESLKGITRNWKFISSTKERKDIKNVAADTTPSRIKLFSRWRSIQGTINDGFSDPDQYSKQYILFHELGHVTGFGGKSKSIFASAQHNSARWSKLSGLPDCFMSSYAMTNKIEDFAETFISYRFNGWALKLSCPQKYDYMKEMVYQGQEYLSQSDCR